MKISREIKISVIFLVGIVLVFWGVNFLKAKHIFSPVRTFYSVYEKVDGLVASNPVIINGLKVGQVDDVEFHPNGSGKILVKLSVTSDFPISKNSIAKVTGDLIGSKSVELILGDSKEFIEDGDTLQAKVQGSLQEEVNVQLLPFKRKVESLMLSLDSALAVIQSVFNENTRNNLTMSFESIKIAIKNIEHMTFAADTLVSSQKTRLASIFANVESITYNFKENNSKLSKIITNFAMLSDTLVKADFAKVITNASNTMAETNAIMEKINSGKGSIGMLINNDSLYNKLDKASEEMGLLIEDIKLNPHRYLNFSVFGPSVKKNKYQPKEKQ